MAVVSVAEIERKSLDRFDPRGGPVREHVVIYQAITDGVASEGETVIASALLPQLGDFYESPERIVNRSMRCIEVNPENDTEYPLRWFVTARFSTQWQSENQLDPNPLLRPLDISSTNERIQVPITRDFFGKTLASSAEEPYDPPQLIDAYTRIFTIVSNAKSFDYEDFDKNFNNRTNLKPWRGYPKFTARIEGANHQTVYEGKFQYDRVTYRVRINYGKRIKPMTSGGLAHASLDAGGLKHVWEVVSNDEEGEGVEWSGWDLIKLDQGHRVAADFAALLWAVGDPVVHLTVGGHPVTSPVLLDGRAVPLDRTTMADTTTPRYHRYWVYDICNFDLLGI